MVQAGRSGGFWQSIRDLPGRTPLRVKLITSLLALVAIALVVISVAGIQILKSNLLGPYDSQLQGSIGREANQAVAPYIQAGNTGAIPGQDFVLDWIPAGGSVHKVIIPYSQALAHGSFLNPSGGAGHPMSGPVIEASQSWISSHLNNPFTLTAQDGSARWRVLMQTVQFSNGQTGTVVLAVDVSSVYNTLGELATIDLLVSVGIIILLGILGVTVVRRSLRPLTDIEQTAGAIAAGDLSRRVPERDPRTEVGRLGRSLNVMLSQIEAAFHARSRSEESARRSEEKMRQFVADASHELRTPLTAIRGFAEYYRQRGGIHTGSNGAGELAPADLDRIMRRVEQEASRMGILVEDMLLLARLDQQRPLEARPVDLLSLAADAVHDARVVAPNRSINLTVGSGAALLVIGDEVRLRQVIGNLMSNALSHTPDGTPIDVLIRSGNLDEAPAVMPPPPPPPEPANNRDITGDRSPDQFSIGPAAADDAVVAGENENPAGELATKPPEPTEPPQPAELPARSLQLVSQPAAVLEVTDHGPGLRRDQAEHVFERFYRADQARTSGGTGLGLAIVAALVAAHGGATWVRSQPGQGATFSIALPLSPEAVQGSDDDFADADDVRDESDAGHDPNWIGSHPEEHARASSAPGNGIVLSSVRARRSGREHAPRRIQGAIPVRPAEQADMHQQRVQLVQRYPLAPAVRQRRRLLVRTQDPVQVRRAKQRQHRQVGLPVPAVCRRVDQPPPTASPQHVAGPAVAVDAARRLGRAGELGRPRARGLDEHDVRAAQAPRVPGDPGVRQHPVHRVPVRPAVTVGVGQHQAGDHARPRRAKPPGPGRVHPGELAAEPGRRVRAWHAVVDPFDDQAARVTT